MSRPRRAIAAIVVGLLVSSASGCALLQQPSPTTTVTDA